jgi:hypothetical protein
MITFLSDEVWPRLRRLARRRNGMALIAVPFIGSGATKRLPLRRGDILVTKFDRASISSGMVDPREIVAFIKRGVEVHSVANLHAKVYIFGRTAVVGSANLSATSEHQLQEAACESNDRRVVSRCRNFVLRLRGEVVELEFARRQLSLWRPPRGPYRKTFAHRAAVRKRVEQSAIVAVSLKSIDYDDTDDVASERAKQAARPRMADSARFRMEDFRWTGRPSKLLKKGVRVVMCTSNAHGRVDLTAPSRVLEVRRYRSRRGAQRTMVVVEVRKFTRERRLRDVLRAVGPDATTLGSIRGAKLLRNQALVYALGQLWPSS